MGAVLSKRCSGDQGRRSRWKEWIPWILVIAALSVRILYQLRYGMEYVDSDTASTMVYVKQLIKEGRWLPSPGWMGSTSLTLTDIPIFRISMMLFQNWHMARTFALFLFMLIEIAAYLLLAHGLGLSRCGVWGLLGLLSVLGFNYNYCIYIGLMYFSVINPPMIALGLYFHAVRKNVTVKSRSLWTAGAFLSGFFFALEGIRIVVFCFLPLFAAALLLCAIKLFRDRSVPSFRQWRRTGRARYLILSFGMLLSSGCGYMINSRVLSRYFSFQNHNITTFVPFDWTNILKMLNALVELLGYRFSFHLVSEENVYTPCPILSLQGVRNGCAVLLLVLITAAIVCGICFRNRFQDIQKLMFVFVLVSLTFNILVDSMSGETTGRYLIVSLIFVFPMLHMVWDIIPWRNSFARKGMMGVFLVLLLIINSWEAIRLVHGSAPLTTPRQKAAEWLVDQGYTKGIAPFWESNVLTEYSDGKLEMWTIDGDQTDRLSLFAWLQDKEHEQSDPEGKIFLLLTEKEADENPVYALKDHIIYHENGMIIYGYNSVSEACRAAGQTEILKKGN